MIKIDKEMAKQIYNDIYRSYTLSLANWHEYTLNDEGICYISFTRLTVIVDAVLHAYLYGYYHNNVSDVDICNTYRYYLKNSLRNIICRIIYTAYRKKHRNYKQVEIALESYIGTGINTGRVTYKKGEKYIKREDYIGEITIVHYNVENSFENPSKYDHDVEENVKKFMTFYTYSNYDRQSKILNETLYDKKEKDTSAIEKTIEELDSPEALFG